MSEVAEQRYCPVCIKSENRQIILVYSRTELHKEDAPLHHWYCPKCGGEFISIGVCKEQEMK